MEGRRLLFLHVLSALAALHGAAGQAPIIASPATLLTTASPISLSYSGFSSETATITLSSRSAPAAVVSSASIASGTSAGAVQLSLPASVQAGVYLLNVSLSTGWKQSADVTIVAPSSLMAVEFDKPLYKPGETVNVRAIAFDANLKPLVGEVNIDIQDPSGFTVGRAKAVPTRQGVAEYSFPLSNAPTLGTWMAVATMGADATAVSESRSFDVNKYVLPTFSARAFSAPALATTLWAPSMPAPGVTVTPGVGFLRLGDKTVPGVVSAAFTSGGPVSGALSINLWQTASYYSYANSGIAVRPGGVASPTVASSSPTAALLTRLSTTLQNGVANFTLTLPGNASATPIAWGTQLIVEATVTESGTGEVRNASATIVTSRNPFSVTLTAPGTFKPGLPWLVKLASANPDGTPRDGTYTLSVSASYQNGTSALPPTRSVTTSNGAATLSLTVPKPPAWCCNASAAVGAKGTECCVGSLSVNLQSTDNVYASAYAPAAQSPAQEYLSLGAQQPAGPAAVGASVTFPVATTVAGGASVSWVLTGSRGVAASGVASPGAPVAFVIPAGLGPTPTLLAFFQTPFGVAADAADVDVAPSLPQAVSAAFNQSTAQPGDAVSVSATAADPTSRVWLLAVDKSVALMGGSTAVNGSSLLAKVAEATASSASSMGDMFSIGRCWGSQPPQQQAGVVLLTPLAVPKCSNGGVFMAFGAAGGGEQMPMAAMADASAARSNSAGAPTAAAATPTTRLRTLFPETWVWMSQAVDGSGSATAALTVPDTITSWQLTAFASGDSGLGVAPGFSQLAVSQPFYIRPALPYSLVRNETLLVNVGVYSTVAAATTATVTLAPSATGAFAIAGPSSVQVSLPAGGGTASAQFTVTPSALGPLALTFAAATADGSASDAVQRVILVSAEGFPVSVTQNAVVNGSSGAVVLPAALPADVVPGSAAATLSVVGDLMGSTIKGLDQLVQVPSGCGEQNIITMAPNVYVLSYYNATRSGLTPDKAAAAVRNTASGFQRELTYRHPDGSFSAFGVSDASGSTWLTAFVLKVFAQSASVTYIDRSVLVTAASFLVANQNRNGVFQSVGSVVHTDMVSGASGDLALTAFVLGALLEVQDASVVPAGALASAASYLAATSVRAGDVYATVLRSYVLNVACASRRLQCAAAAAALRDMLAAGTQGPAFTFWTAAGKAAAPAPPPVSVVNGRGVVGSPYSYEAPSNDVELTGYAVLALVTAGRVADALSPARWLLTQRSAFGGYRSTQDTVIGLQALSRYAAAVFDRDVDLQISAQAAGAPAVASFSVTTGNFDLLQQSSVLAAGENVTVTLSGTGQALVQLATAYNVYTDPKPASFAVTTNVTAVTATLWHLQVCVARLPAAPAAAAGGAMVMVEVGVFSGWQPVQSSLDALQASSSGLVKLIEQNGQTVQMYLSELPKLQTCLSFDITQAYTVTGLADAAVVAYSYYAPDETGSAKVPALRAAALQPAGAPVPSTVTVGGAAPAPGPVSPPPAAAPAPSKNGDQPRITGASIGSVLLASVVGAFACSRISE